MFRHLKELGFEPAWFAFIVGLAIASTVFGVVLALLR